ncbi:MAG TPA: hypothetical protein VMI53_07250 [Opitutaceae bacterium]|nr:hypothetical protein [Opitutaceae bacterium]
MNPVRAAILAGGTLNSLLGLFHVFLCGQIFQAYGSKPFYPLLEMMSIGGTLLIFFLAFTSLFCPAALVETRIGRSVVLLNISVYLARTLGEFILFPKPSGVIIGLCAFLTLLYAYIYFCGRSGSATHLTAL